MAASFRNYLGKFTLVTAVALLAGCTMRPPSAGAFMSAYQNRDSMNGFLFESSISIYTASTSDSAVTTPENEHSTSVWEDVVENEWPFDFGMSFMRFIDHVGFGLGFQTFNPYLTLGAAFEHFGIMGWTDWRLIAVCAGEPGALRGGISVMEQISPTKNMLVGLFQFASRSEALYSVGDGDYWIPHKKEDDSYSSSCWEDDTDCYWIKGTSKDGGFTYYGFIEYGGGAYMRYKMNSVFGLGLEFKYSYDVTYKAKRLAFTFSAFLG